MSFVLEPPAPPLHRSAVLSDCERYRYLLMRSWNEACVDMVCILCNPSTADALKDDPTIRVLMGMARRRGFGGIRVVNLFAFRATDPAEIHRASDPVGPENDDYIRRMIRCSDRDVLCAWGDIGAGERARAVLAQVRELGRRPVAVRLSKAGNPVHPLRQRLDGELVEILEVR